MRLTQALLSSALAALSMAATTNTLNATTTSGGGSAPTSGSAEPYKLQTPPLDTDWTSKVGTNPWPEHPRPQLRREKWLNLNGIWTYRAASGGDDVNHPPSGSTLDREVLIPSCIESGLSGLQELGVSHFWLATTFQVPMDWGNQTVLINFEAVDYEATVFINGQKAGFHRGGYFRFTIDATMYLKPGGNNTLLVFVFDPTDEPGYVVPIGKQTRSPSHIFYRSCSGIWQTVWLESTPQNRITQLDVAADHQGNVNVLVHSYSSPPSQVHIAVIDNNGQTIGESDGTSDSPFNFTVSSPNVWSPSNPNLYNITVTMGRDKVSSYTGFRTISTGMVDGVKRPLLNGEFIFMFGTLDQGYWPDGLYLPPTVEAMTYDLKVLKNLGMNMVRKHIKVEPDLFYHACDTLGLLVIQDMPSLTADSSRLPNPEQQAEFERQLQLMIQEHKSYTSIVTWTIYNEGWGQLRGPPYPEETLVEIVRKIDPTRLIDANSGWYDHGFGDYSDNHHYANPQCGTPFYSLASSPYDASRIGFQGEFGGIGHNVSIEHLWNVQQAIDTINQTYEIDENLEAYNYRGRVLLREFREQVEMYACSGGVWTQTSDVEGEVNGLVTYDRRVLRPDIAQWQVDIKSLFDAARSRSGSVNGTM
ncbi:glycosyl hydrolase family 2 [Colletotrichum graminicola]|uniref:Glycosyl hydrolase family 2 n=1 Tax=Colletotrichum graminicola (strain M1.001 / M2 / FGSC 10212) TaxID=645133 RepID=E3QKA1_COLGM|nr:glycosyl hydrolase family 2 [Colletotrichum graminicola M1.001]EFQ31289.1 glycosyl hydrolase family 2 [Colletotrichum graminicola M1.001]WDK19299.1 glycosyl hydrolase family 2 [Colletotrichum graminicola]